MNNTSFLNNLTPHIDDKKLSHWQIACDGIWEEAYKILPQTEQPDTLKKLVNQSDDIAIEAFLYTQDRTDFFFFGLRIEKLSKTDKLKFLTSLIENVEEGSPLTTIRDQIKNITTCENILDKRPNLLEIGAEGFWKSYGSYVVWENKNEQPPASHALIQKEAPQIVTPFKRPMMLEFAWEEPFPSWVGIPVSIKKDNDPYIFSERHYNQLIKFI